jgi:hypothetical protein
MKRFLIVLIVLGISSSLFAVDLKDFSIYGSVRAGTWYDQTERALNDTLATYTDSLLQQQAVVGGDPEPKSNFTLIPYGNIGLKYKTSRMNVVFELGVLTGFTNAYMGGGTTDGFILVKNQRFLAGVSRFFAEIYLNDYFTFLVGQDFVPACFLSSNQMYFDNNSFGNTGSLYAGKQPMLQIAYSSMKNSPLLGVEVKVAAIRVDTSTFQYYRSFPNKFTSTDSKFPKFESSVEAKLNGEKVMADLKAVAGFQQYNIRLTQNYIAPDSEKIDPVNCYVAGVHGGVKMSKVSLQGDFAFGQNLGPYGVYVGNPFVLHGQGGIGGDLIELAYPFYGKDSTGQLLKAESMVSEADVIAGIRASSRLAFEAGFGWVHESLGKAPFTEALNSRWHDTYAGYLQAEIKLMDILVVTPEIGYYYYGPRLYYGRTIYGGFETRVDF